MVGLFPFDAKALSNSDAFILFFMAVGPVGGLLLYSIQRALKPRPVAERARAAGGSLFLSETLKDYGYWWLNWQAAILVRLRVHPTTITLGGMLVVWAAAAFVANGYFGIGGMWILLGSLSDMLDGMVARRRNLMTRGGTFVDSMVDRYSDLGLFGGLLVLMRHRPGVCAIILLATVGTAMVSYARAKAEALGVANVPKGWMQRAERAVYLGFATYLSPLLARRFNAPGDDTPWLAIGVCALIAVLANASALRMSLFTVRALNASPGRAARQPTVAVLAEPAMRSDPPDDGEARSGRRQQPMGQARSQPASSPHA